MKNKNKTTTKKAKDLKVGDVVVFADAKMKITSLGRFRDTVLLGDSWLESRGDHIGLDKEFNCEVEVPAKKLPTYNALPLAPDDKPVQKSSKIPLSVIIYFALFVLLMSIAGLIAMNM